jgi:hypothetical protein
MRRIVSRSAAVLAGAVLLSCTDAHSPAAPGDPPASTASAPGAGPSLKAAVFHRTVDFAFLNDFDRNISATIGLVSRVADLDRDPDCGGSGPRIVDLGREKVVITPSNLVQFSDRWHKATFVLYSGAVADVCELSATGAHPVIASGKVNYRFAIRVPDFNAGAVDFHFHMTGKVDLASGGKAHILINANYHFDDNGNLTVHVDRFVLKPIAG